MEVMLKYEDWLCGGPGDQICAWRYCPSQENTLLYDLTAVLVGVRREGNVFCAASVRYSSAR